MITDSVVLCFFVESDKILSVLRSDRAVEDFLWQESAIVLAKLLLPQIFEKMSMQDLRALVAERSTMTTYITGETIEVPRHSIGFLLEGFIKSYGFQGDLIASPAALLPPHRNQSLQDVEISGTKAASFSHQRLWYQVETRARVIVFDINAFEADSALQRSSSFLTHSVDHPLRPPSREHGGLMSWPENFFKTTQQNQNLKEINQPANSLSARAMQLSIFGSTVDGRWRTHSFPGNGIQRTHSHSLFKAGSFHSRPLVSVRSEGSSMGRKNLLVRTLTGKVPDHPLQSTGINESCDMDNLSDESGCEEDHIISIDSPSGLSFRQTS